MSYIVSVLTPTYNREKELHNLYKSLKSQTNKEFEWVIVDDGSSDNTEEVVKGWIDEKTLDIKYIKQENGGKHTAVNTGVAQISSPLTFIVDSDDILTADAIDSIIGDSAEVVNNDKLCGIGYLRGFSETDVIGDKFSINRAIGNFNVERYKRNIKGDKAEVWKTSDMKALPFPKFEGEQFMGEGYAWSTFAKHKDMFLVNKIIYLTEYLEGGLTRQGRRLRIKCPKGGMTGSEVLMDPVIPLKIRIKYGLLYVAYSKFDGLKICETIKKTKYGVLTLFCYLPGLVLYIYWKKKFLIDGE